jgi:hypothetical protein
MGLLVSILNFESGCSDLCFKWAQFLSDCSSFAHQLRINCASIAQRLSYDSVLFRFGRAEIALCLRVVCALIAQRLRFVHSLIEQRLRSDKVMIAL